MNYIKQLERDLLEARCQRDFQSDRVQEFREHLALPKFTDENWISVADVQRWLRYITSATDEA